ncbi:hypothetical protein [Corynebacterium macclintockiae]|uniref:hypothetical protein n=1 Tax=Corynebacterium macclintockiae TaxID=2913501 RepID=UPI00055726BC|nr:hypothetical protein [Corynebacterium macclintockiae]MDK8870217.1 hypothetical protein [Corynebacterium macclintockiae]
MRKFRNAALAVATATTVAISGVSVAAAEDGQTPPAKEQTQGLKGSLELDKPASGKDIRNWLDPKYKEDDKGDFGMWAKLLVGGGIAAAAASVFGLIIAPAYNFLKYNGFLG